MFKAGGAEEWRESNRAMLTHSNLYRFGFCAEKASETSASAWEGAKTGAATASTKVKENAAVASEKMKPYTDKVIANRMYLTICTPRAPNQILCVVGIGQC